MAQTLCHLILSSPVRWTSSLSHSTGEETEAQRGVADSYCTRSRVRAAGCLRSRHRPPPYPWSGSPVLGFRNPLPVVGKSGMWAFEVKVRLLALLHTGPFSPPNNTVLKACSCYFSAPEHSVVPHQLQPLLSPFPPPALPMSLGSA